MDFIDLVGASGAAYRFRRAGEALSPSAGNFVYVRDVEGRRQVVCCGKARVLATAITTHPWVKDEYGRPEDVLYVRLNVARSTRDAEHDDLVEGLPRPFAIYEID